MSRIPTKAVFSNGRIINFPDVPQYSFPSVPKPLTLAQQNALKVKQEITADMENRKKDVKLDQTLADVRRKYEREQEIQSAKDDADLNAEFEKLEKQYGTTSDCSKDKKGKGCSIMGGRTRRKHRNYKKSRKGRKQRKSISHKRRK